SDKVFNSTKNSAMKTVDYDSYKNEDNPSNDSITQEPDVWATTDIAGVQYEVMYCEISGIPFKPPFILKKTKGSYFDWA
ncbi:42696_t:CDS:1, partial [Gigaspora margarita]